MVEFTNYLGVSHTLFATTVITIVALIGSYWYQRKKRLVLPESWKLVGKIKQLFIYPLKSGRRIPIRRGECTEYGIKLLKEDEPAYQLRDRQLLVYNAADNEFRTGRQYPKLLLVELSVHDRDHFALDAPNMRTLYVKIPKPEQCKPQQITSHKNEKIFMVDCGDEAGQWFSRYILEKDEGLRLGFHDGKHRRDITNSHKAHLEVYENLNNEATGMYSDLSSFLLVNQASVDDLNSKLVNTEVTFHNFRPNIVVEEAPAFDEDNWDWVKIGDVVFRRVRPCTRCILTTINPETTVKDPNREPLKTLETYRLVNDPKTKALDGRLTVMGANLGLKIGGIIKVGDEVFAGKDI